MDSKQLNRLAHGHGIDLELMQKRLVSGKIIPSTIKYEAGVGYVGETGDGEQKVFYYVEYRNTGEKKPFWGKRAKLLAAMTKNGHKNSDSNAKVRVIIPKQQDVLSLKPSDFKA